jgi:E3 ubiquitin-protein ligase RNF115/126
MPYLRRTDYRNSMLPYLVYNIVYADSSQVTPGESDPRPASEPENHDHHDFDRLQHHNPWETTDSDPDEADIDEHITGFHGPHGGPRVTYFSRTIRSRGDGRDAENGEGDEQNPDVVMTDFHNMLSGLIGPGFRAGQSGRSGPETLFTGGPFTAGGGNFQSFGGRTTGGRVMGARYTFTTNVPTQGGSAERGEGQGDDISAYDPPIKIVFSLPRKRPGIS